MTTPAVPAGPAAGAVVLGLDVGGSKTHGLRVEDRRVVREAFAGSANISSVGAAEAGRQLDLVIGQLVAEGVAAVCAGAAGADTPEGQQRMARLLAERLPGTRISVVHDATIILSAAELDHGIVVIAGTGSVAWGIRADGVQARAGGWGYLLGDEGSGYRLARDAVCLALADLDRGAPPSPLTLRLVAQCGLASPQHLLDHFYAQPERRYWADRARVVSELGDQGDADAGRLLAGAADALAALAVAVAERLSLSGTVVLGGGLVVHTPALHEQVRARLGERGITDVRVLNRDPVHGAVRLAERLAGERRPLDLEGTP